MYTHSNTIPAQGPMVAAPGVPKHRIHVPGGAPSGWDTPMTMVETPVGRFRGSRAHTPGSDTSWKHRGCWCCCCHVYCGNTDPWRAVRGFSPATSASSRYSTPRYHHHTHKQHTHACVLTPTPATTAWHHTHRPNTGAVAAAVVNLATV